MFLEKLKKTKISKNLIEKLPEFAGIYIFYDQAKKPLYIGKSVNIKKRVASYFAQKLEIRTKRMIEQSAYLSHVRTDSEMLALLLEAKLIKKYQPKYNVIAKDDKHPLYIKITKERYPRVLIVRKGEADKESLAIFGPFPSSSTTKEVLRFLRKIFPFAEHKVGKRPCIRSQIGLCNPCPSVIETNPSPEQKKIMKTKYLKNIRHLIAVLSGNINAVQKELEKAMRSLSKEERFEEAEELRRQLEKLNYITSQRLNVNYFLKNPNLIEDIRKKESENLLALLKDYFVFTKPIKRIECFDVAHLSGTFPTASMVTFINGEADKKYYRHFKIRQERGKDDISSLEETAKRRARHLEDWGSPDLIVVDGGRGQVSAFLKVFETFGIPVVGLAKRKEELIIRKGNRYLTIRPTGPSLFLLQRLRNEAHRFARKYHHKLIKNSLIPRSAIT